MKDMKRLFGYMGPYKKDMILGALFVMIETGFELFIPIMISNLIDIGVANHDVNYIYVIHKRQENLDFTRFLAFFVTSLLLVQC